MDKFKELVSNCKASVEISVNNHKDYYQTVIQYIDEFKEVSCGMGTNLDDEIIKGMADKNTIVEVQAYPDTPVGSYKIFHYDIDKAVDIMLNLCKGN